MAEQRLPIADARRAPRRQPLEQASCRVEVLAAGRDHHRVILPAQNLQVLALAHPHSRVLLARPLHRNHVARCHMLRVIEDLTPPSV